MCSEIRATRKYTLKRRAEQQAETRQRIVDAAVHLHGTLGPNRTTVSMVAERAGVQRHTFYAHFPDEKSLLLACSAHSMVLNPPPDAADWTAIADAHERLRTGLGAIYAWYERGAEMTANVLRDAEENPIVREIVELRRGPWAAAWVEALGAVAATPAQRATLALALSFYTWRTLTRDAKLGTKGAADLMAGAILAAA